MNPKQYELPSPESTDLEPLAKALVALRRDEEPLAPSAELRRQVEARLGELETNAQGKVITKEKAMLKNSTGGFRLRDWVFFAGGSIAAAVATTIIFWPAPKTETAVSWSTSKAEVTASTPGVKVASESMKQKYDKRKSLFEYQRADASASSVQDESSASQSSRTASESAQPAGAGGVAGMGAGGVSGGMPGSGVGGGAPGMPGFGGYQGGPVAGNGSTGGKRSNSGSKGGAPYGVPGGGGYLPSFESGDITLPASSGPNPYPPPGLTLEAKPDANDSSPGKAPEVDAIASVEIASPATSLSRPAAPSADPASPRAVVVQGGTRQHPSDSRERYYRARVKGKEGPDGYASSLMEDGESRFQNFYYGEGVDKGIKTGEQYNTIIENQFLAPTSEPLSTFSIDVDTASYSNIRRFLTSGQMPPPAAVRIEEMVNYFGYSYAQPKGKEPFAVNMETADCPWNPGHVLLRVGLKGKEIERKARPASNLVFLLDVSGSMADENKLPLLKTTMTMLTGELTENDRVTIVTYAGDAGLKLEPTSGDQKQKITDAINSLSAGGSTNGSAGIDLAYQKAAEAFIKEGTNRVILATDGDLNVGVTSDDALVKLIKEKAAGGTFLTVLGFGEGNLKDGKLEQIADNGNGMYAYIDSVREGRKVMVEQLTGSLVTIAKDVKIQIEFNPAQVQSYRLLGYENRVMAAADFNNDKKDAGEIGAGHTVTALYELVPVEVSRKENAPRPDVEPLKYQKAITAAVAEPKEPKALTDAATSGELLTLKLRYKEPDGVESRLIEFPLKERGKQFNSASKDFQFAAAVASFGMILRGSQHRGSSNASAVAEIAAGAIGEDPNGLRAEFVDLVRRAEKLGIK
jgi:Ca-activated chloride channel family protein